MFGRILVLAFSLILAGGGAPRGTAVRSFGILVFRPDGIRRTAILHSGGELNTFYESESGAHVSDGYLFMKKANRDKIFALAAAVYESAESSEAAPLDYEQLFSSPGVKNKVIVFVAADDGKEKVFRRDFDKKFDSPELRRLDLFLEGLLEK